MNEQQTRLLQIASDVLQWNLDMLAYFRQVGEVENMPDISDADKEQLRETAIKLGELFTKVGELSDSQPTANDLIEQLIASHDRMREELTKANQKLAAILANRKT
ncbi:MAG TPA: hypothetical protein VIX59_03375 [Candidatus Binataceae bacterium]